MKRVKESFENRIGVIEDRLESEKSDKKRLEKTFEEEIRSKDEEIAEIKADFRKFKNIIEEKTESKLQNQYQDFNREMEKKSSQIESKLTDLVTSISKTDVEALVGKITHLETIISEVKDKVSSQPDLEVTTNDNKTIEYNYHNNASSSVQKSKQESGLETEKSYSSINIQHSNISNSASGVEEDQVSNISTKVIEVDQVAKSYMPQGNNKS